MGTKQIHGFARGIVQRAMIPIIQINASRNTEREKKTKTKTKTNETQRTKKRKRKRNNKRTTKEQQSAKNRKMNRPNATHTTLQQQCCVPAVKNMLASNQLLSSLSNTFVDPSSSAHACICIYWNACIKSICNKDVPIQSPCHGPSSSSMRLVGSPIYLLYLFI